MWLAYSFTTHKLLFFGAHFIVVECLVHFSNLHAGVLLAGLHPAAEQPGGRGGAWLAHRRRRTGWYLRYNITLIAPTHMARVYQWGAV